ncbi:hypothetical protein IFJ82_13980 [Novacetimonas hansenii]|jgi:hypothetical protein|uniref:hypothetical protein n=1 Tax=Novacetimonas hansenii TaxID=436 RepID=UPI001780AFF8|nr:hypothetical protein [Novacetimonas hansenii]QOF94928.1 hypothetical protein IFJ82_13980 [Novacetimonas hansenii]
MFAAPRFLAVDDKPKHLEAILETFQRIGAPCMGICFDPSEPLEKTVFRGVRALFLDLHLISGVKTTDDKQHFANIASILEDNISEIGGPFILILWTEHAHMAVALTTYLEQSLDREKPWCRPLAVMALAKEKFINVGNGTIELADDLKQAVESVLNENPQIAALMEWEKDVLAAAGETLSSLTSLVPAERRSTTQFGDALDEVLSRLAVEAVGKKHVSQDPRTAVTSVLAPILSDRIVNQETVTATAELWSKAVTRYGDKTLPQATPLEAGGINRMLHVSMLSGEQITPADWGAVSEVPLELWDNDNLTDMLGVNIDHLLRQEFKINRKHHGLCRPRLVRIGAICDHAQQRPGPLPLLFAVEVPIHVERLLKDKQGNNLPPPAAEWRSPVITLPDQSEPFVLHVNSRFEITRPAVAMENWTVSYRLREQLLMQLITHTTTYVGRPGIVRLG